MLRHIFFFIYLRTFNIYKQHWKYMRYLFRVLLPQRLCFFSEFIFLIHTMAERISKKTYSTYFLLKTWVTTAVLKSKYVIRSIWGHFRLDYTGTRYKLMYSIQKSWSVSDNNNKIEYQFTCFSSFCNQNKKCQIIVINFFTDFLIPLVNSPKTNRMFVPYTPVHYQLQKNTQIILGSFMTSINRLKPQLTNSSATFN